MDYRPVLPERTRLHDERECARRARKRCGAHQIRAPVKSIHAITEQERALARPLRLRVITAQSGLTFAEMARRSPLGKFAEGRLRIINGLYPAGEPVAGQALKIIE